jgi:hypothetical protein
MFRLYLFEPSSGWSIVSLWKWYIQLAILLSIARSRITFSFRSVVCLTTCPKLPPKRAFHIVRSRAVFLNRRAATRYRALASIIPGRESLSFWFSKHFSWINIFYWKYSEENNIRECVEKLRPRTPKEHVLQMSVTKPRIFKHGSIHEWSGIFRHPNLSTFGKGNTAVYDPS